MDKRRQEGRYFRCGASGYRIKRCEFLDPRRPTDAPSVRGLRAAPGKSALIEPLLESEGSDSEDNSETEDLN